LDLISCYMAGVQNVVAPQGTALTQEHTRILKRYVGEVVLCFDSDEAGQKAAVRVLDDVLGSGLAVRVATVPAPDDPDSFIKKHGGAAFGEVIQKAEGFFDYYLGRLCRLNDIRTDKGQKAVLTAMATAVQKTNDPTLFDKYAQRTAARLGVNALNALQVFKNSRAKPGLRPEQSSTEQEPDFSWRPNPQEFWLLKILLLQDEMLEWTRDHLDTNWVQNPYVREILNRRLSFDENGQSVQPAAILNQVESAEMKSLITESLAEDRDIPKPEQQLVELTTRLRNQHIDKQLAGLIQQISTPGISEADSIRLLQERNQLSALKRSPLQSA